ncbi:hypothetical protein G6F31_020342 [Rhizopus arrhizus]|nr:hypothetical protein G6F31_020342 [Rhizopus arrhizus]
MISGMDDPFRGSLNCAARLPIRSRATSPTVLSSASASGSEIKRSSALSRAWIQRFWLSTSMVRISASGACFRIA